MEQINAKSIPSPVGESKTRIDAREKVTGAAIFADDIQFGKGLLYARIKRSPHPHARIKSIDVSKALALPGVMAIVTGEDFPGYIGLYLQDRHIFCREKVRYVGDPVAGVAATSFEMAEKALGLIDVEYELLDPVLDPVIGASPEAPLLHPDLGEYKVANFIFPEAGTNISNHFKIRKGNVDGAWANCAAIIERTYRIPHIQHVPIEPHVAIARARRNGGNHAVGKLTVAIRPEESDCQLHGNLAEQNAGGCPLCRRGFWKQGRRKHGSLWWWRSLSK